MNAVAYAQLTFQMLTLLQKYLYWQSQYSNIWDSKCVALIAQVFRAFGMNPKVGGLSPPQVETFSVSKSLTIPQELISVSESKINIVAWVQLTFEMLTLLTNNYRVYHYLPMLFHHMFRKFFLILTSVKAIYLYTYSLSWGQLLTDVTNYTYCGHPRISCNYLDLLQPTWPSKSPVTI